MRRLRKTIQKALASTVLLCFAFCQCSYGITTAEEEELSREFMKTIGRQVTLVKDPLIQEYVASVGERIVKVLPPQPFKYHFYVVEESVYNAFAGPAGNIFINSGLFADMESYGEMAGILGHEISHVACRHISDKIEKSKKIGIATIAGLAAAIGLGVAGAGAAANAAMVGSLAAGQSMMLAYSREDEIQADQLGLVYLTDAGYAAEGLLDALKRIRSRQWFGKDLVPTYMMTHPALEDRLAYVDGWVESHPERKRLENPADQRAFLDARNRLIALCLEPETALRRLRAGVEKDSDDVSSLHGYGLVLMRTGDHANAESYMKKALGTKPLDTTLLTDLGQVYFLQGRYPDADKILSGALAMRSDHPDAQFFLGRTHLAASDYRAAIETLGRLADQRSDYPEVHYFLASAQEGVGRPDLSHYHLALHYKEKGDWENAIQQMKRALSLAKDPAEQDKMREALKEFEKTKKKEREDAPESGSRNLNVRSVGGQVLDTGATRGGSPIIFRTGHDRSGKTAW